jgi:hypothetical protein
MANRAYVSAWAKDYSEATQHERLQNLLATVPFSASWPGFTGLVVRALEPAEAPIREWDLRAQMIGSAEIIELMREPQGPDIAYEIRALWDLWIYDLDSGRWQSKPQELQIDCYGSEYDGGIAEREGDFLIDIGFEHLFTGHAGMLGANPGPKAPAAHLEEARFLASMASPERLREYHQRTRENIQILLHWLRDAETSVPLERYKLWSEGEENFESRVDEILAVR